MVEHRDPRPDRGGRPAARRIRLALVATAQPSSPHPTRDLSKFARPSLAGPSRWCLGLLSALGVLFFVSLYLQGLVARRAPGRLVRPSLSSPRRRLLQSLRLGRPDRFGPWLPITVGLLASSIALFSLVTLQVDSPEHRPLAGVHPARRTLPGIGRGDGGEPTPSSGSAPVDDAGSPGECRRRRSRGGVLGTVCAVRSWRLGSGASLVRPDPGVLRGPESVAHRSARADCRRPPKGSRRFLTVAGGSWRSPLRTAVTPPSWSGCTRPCRGRVSWPWPAPPSVPLSGEAARRTNPSHELAAPVDVGLGTRLRPFGRMAAAVGQDGPCPTCR